MKFNSSDSNVPDVDMTPMIDIVFQLIAFFMVITNFEQTRADERVRLPKDQLATPPEVKYEHAVTLNVGFFRDKDGNIERDNPAPQLFTQDGAIPIRQSSPYLRKEAQFYEVQDIDLSEVTVEIRADADVPTGLVQRLIQLCQETRATGQSTKGFERFAIKATQKID